MKENYLPSEWRNKVFRFQAGGYSGCVYHPAALIVDGNGEVHLVGSDGGAGGLDEIDWYCRKCRSYLDSKGVLDEGEFLYGLKKNEEHYKEFRRLKEEWHEERRRRERANVLEALTNERGKESDEIPGWDHEFELIGEIDTKEKVVEVCKKTADYFYDVYYRAEIADKLRSAGYEGAGFVCTLCGKYVEDSDYESFKDHIDHDAYHGIGGLATANTSILCHTCRQDLECPQCYALTRRPSSEGDKAYDHMNFREAFIVQWLGVCEYCADNFFHEEKYKHWGEDVNEIEEKIGVGQAQLKKYISHMRELGRSDEELEKLRKDNLETLESNWRGLVNRLRDQMEKDVKSYFSDANDWADERIKEGEHYVW